MVDRGDRLRQFGRVPFATAPFGGEGAGAHGGLIGNSVKPIADDVLGLDGVRFADQDQKHGLKGVFRVVLVAQNAPADAAHHRPVPADQRGESIGVAVG